jgi:glycosidase
MPTSIWSDAVQAAFDAARQPTTRVVTIGTGPVTIPSPFPSPADWRDQWIYFLMVDRFNNPAAPPRHLPYDAPCSAFQGGTLAGIREQLGYLKQLGTGALWLSPVLKNNQLLNGQPNEGTYHGYGIQDFLAVDPRLASDPTHAAEELRELVDAAHAHGLFVILDIVLNHTADVFAYQGIGSEAPWQDQPYPTILWRDADGQARSDWTVGEAIPSPPADAAVWPAELRENAFFRRQGKPRTSGDVVGDFFSLKQLRTDNRDLWNVLIRAYQYAIATYDIDGFRIDTLKFIDPAFALTFGNAMREFALSIGKKNFFTFGEIAGDEWTVAQFIGRNVTVAGDLLGVDAALDFPLFGALQAVAKGLAPPSQIAALYGLRQFVERNILSSHGEATNFFVTFLDNHDQNNRFYFRPDADPHAFDDQLTLGLGCLFGLIGIPCLYYGTEQGLHGGGNYAEAVREALWGKPDGFDQTSAFYRAVQQLAALRRAHPALRYGRQYLRPVSGNGSQFGISTTFPGVLAFSRVLSDREMLVVANTQTQATWNGSVLVDFGLNPPNAPYRILFSNQQAPTPPQAVIQTPSDTTVTQADGTMSSGSVRAVPVQLRPMEIQILTQGS